MKEKIKASWRFRIANWILSGTLRKALDEVINNLEMFLTISRWPTEPDIYMHVDALENHLLVRSVGILLTYLEKRQTTFRFKLANFVCKSELIEMLKTTMYSIFDILRSIEYKDFSAGLKDISIIRFNLECAQMYRGYLKEDY